MEVVLQAKVVEAEMSPTERLEEETLLLAQAWEQEEITIEEA